MPAFPGDVGAAYASMLERQHWRWFCTLTFSPTKRVTDRVSRKTITVDRFHPIRGMHLEAADKAWRWWIFELNKTLYGNNWRRVPHGGLIWARGQEFHKSGRVHFHAVIAAPDGDLDALASRYWWHELWYREFGRNQIEQALSQADIAAYVSKYVAKDGEVDLSANFGKVEPLRLFDAVQDRTAGVRAIPASLDDRSSTGVRPEKTCPDRACLSLTLPLRPEFEQQRFTDQSFFETQTDG